MTGGRLAGVSAGPSEHLPLQALGHSGRMSGPRGTAVSSDPGTVSWDGLFQECGPTPYPPGCALWGIHGHRWASQAGLTQL